MSLSLNETREDDPSLSLHLLSLPCRLDARIRDASAFFDLSVITRPGFKRDADLSRESRL